MSTFEPPASVAVDYTESVEIRAERTRVYQAISSLEGLQSWWTPLVSGSANAGEDLKFEFEGLDESIVMHVEETNIHTFVRWICRANTGHPEWIGTQPTFRIMEGKPHECILDFRHIGLNPDLSCYQQCERGWHYFLGSIAAYAESGQGTPFGS